MLDSFICLRCPGLLGLSLTEVPAWHVQRDLLVYLFALMSNGSSLEIYRQAYHRTF